MLNPKAPTPLYRQLADELTERIRKGEFGPGDQLPSEPELARTHHLGRPTVRQATELLMRQGLVQRKRGAGTFVIENTPAVDLFSLAGTVSSFESSGLKLETQLLDWVRWVKVGPKGRNPFSGSEVFRYVRLGHFGPRHVLLEYVFLSPQVFPGFGRLNYKGTSLAEFVRDHYDLAPSGGTQSFEVGRGSATTRNALGAKDGQSLLVIRRTLDFPNAPSALYSLMYCRTDNVHFTQTLVDPRR